MSDANNKMKSEALQAKIDQTIRHLQDEVALLQKTHLLEMELMKIDSVQYLQRLREDFDQRIQKADEHHRNKISMLEEEIQYLKELNDSQRLMMTDNASYIRALEEKLGQPVTFPPAADAAGRT